MKKHILIVGGGFGGVVAARKLSGYDNLKITLISDQSNFRYSPALYRVATGHRQRTAVIPLDYALPKNVVFIEGSITKINRSQQTITLNNKIQLGYDKIILSLGVVTSYFNIPGLEENSFGIKNLAQLNQLRTHLHNDLVKNQSFDSNYLIVGGGPTGVELAADLGKYLRRMARQHHIKKRTVSLKIIEAQPRLLPTLNPKISKAATKRLHKLGVVVKTNKKVEYGTSRTLRVDNKSIPTQTVIWTAGTTNNPFYQKNKSQFKFSEKNKIIVDNRLRVDQNTYVIGDNAQTTYSGLAQTAIHQANFVAKDIEQSLNNGDTPDYTDHCPINIVPIGNKWAVLQYGKFCLSGWIPGILRTAADIIGYADIIGLKNSIKLWYGDKLPTNCMQCQPQSNEE